MKDKVTLAEIIEQLSDETYISKTAAQDYIGHLTDILLKEITEKEKAAITNFGSFTVVEVAERNGVNPQTGEPISIPAHKRISFTPYKALEKKVNHEYDHLEAKVIEDNSDKAPKNDDSSKSEPNSAEALFNTLTTSPGKQPSPDDDPFNFEEEPEVDKQEDFNPTESLGIDEEEITATPVESDDEVLDDILGLSDEPEESTIEKTSVDEVVLETEVVEEVELTLEADEDEQESDIFEESGSIQEEKEVEEEENPAGLRTPGLPNRNKSALNPTVLLAVLATFVIMILAIWFFFLRTDSTQTQTADSESAPSTQTDPINDPLAFEPPSNTESTQSDEPAETESQVIPMVAADVDLSENPGEMRSINNPEPQIEMQETIAVTYTTGSGVWIYEIARQTYGNTRLWPLIFQANYTTANDPDLILPNVNLNIPKLEGTTDNPSSEDYRRLADAARYVAVAYEQAGNDSQAAAYRKAADWYESMR
ncbi:MAG: HU family DNA-binding protein [Balneolaceae bacterium]|nr:HU family DNA-binding protein [Balneolaceae bacterium]